MVQPLQEQQKGSNGLHINSKQSANKPGEANVKAQTVTKVELHSWDVLIGRGRGYLKHPGNKRLRLLVKMNAGKYKKEEKGRKMTVAKTIVNDLANMIPLSRFVRKLHNHGDAYVLVSFSDATAKTLRALQNQRSVPMCISEISASLLSLSEKLEKQFHEMDHAVTKDHASLLCAASTKRVKQVPVKQRESINKSSIPRNAFNCCRTNIPPQAATPCHSAKQRCDARSWTCGDASSW
jgi:hypothetical protein